MKALFSVAILATCLNSLAVNQKKCLQAVAYFGGLNNEELRIVVIPHLRALRDKIESADANDVRLPRLSRAIDGLETNGLSWAGLNEVNHDTTGSTQWLSTILNSLQMARLRELEETGDWLRLTLSPYGVPHRMEASHAAIARFGDIVARGLPGIKTFEVKFHFPGEEGVTPTFEWAERAHEIVLSGTDDLKLWKSRGFFGTRHVLKELRVLRVAQDTAEEMARQKLWMTLKAPRLETLILERPSIRTIDQIASNKNICNVLGRFHVDHAGPNGEATDVVAAIAQMPFQSLHTLELVDADVLEFELEALLASSWVPRLHELQLDVNQEYVLVARSIIDAVHHHGASAVQWKILGLPKPMRDTDPVERDQLRGLFPALPL